MNSNEMREWLTYHDAAFHGYLAWMKKAHDGTDTALKDRMNLWAGRVADVPTDVARRATEAMFNNGVDLPNGKHLGWICDFNSRQKPEQEAFSHTCRLCNGTGIVSVKFFHDRLTFGGNPLPDNIGQAACQCSEGRHLNEMREKCWHDNKETSGGKLEPFDKSRMAIHEYEANVGRYEISDRHRQAGRLEMAKLIEEFGYAPERG
jgi:hypothetical protein